MKTDANEINDFILFFTDIDDISPDYDEPLTVYISTAPMSGYIKNIKFKELGLYAVVVEKWIKHSDLEELIGHTVE